MKATCKKFVKLYQFCCSYHIMECSVFVYWLTRFRSCQQANKSPTMLRRVAAQAAQDGDFASCETGAQGRRF